MTPIIFITAFASDEFDQADRFAEGAVDFMFAPVAPEELRAKVSVFANLYIKANTLAHQASEAQAAADQFRLLADAAPIGIFQTDAENRYVYTNPRWTEITGSRPTKRSAGRGTRRRGRAARESPLRSTSARPREPSSPGGLSSGRRACPRG